MGSATGMKQLFRNICHHSIWRYAILWKFPHENSMILTCEDSYALDAKSGTSTGYASYEEFISCHPWGSNVQSGNSPSYSIIVAVSNMTKISYLLGEGIVGKAASMENHKWICVEEMSSDLLLECPEELRLHVAAGIKTILFLPLLPLGLVQLGSLDKLSEDLAMVAQLKDLFCPYQHTLLSGPRMERTESSMTLSLPSLEKYSTSLEINTKFTDPMQFQPLKIPDLTTLDQMMLNELLPVGSGLFPSPFLQSCGPPIQDDLHHVHGLDTDLLYENSGNMVHSELFGYLSEEQFMFDTSFFSGRILESDQKCSLHENKHKVIPVNKANLAYVEEFDLIIDSTTNSKYMDFSIEAGAYKTMEHSCLVSSKNTECKDDESKADEGSELIAIFKEGRPEAFEFPHDESKADEGSELIAIFKEESPEAFEFSHIEPCLIMNENRTDYFPGLSDGKKLESCDCAQSPSSPTGRCTFCITRCKAEDVPKPEDSGFSSHNFSSLQSTSKGFSHPTCPSRTSVHLAPENMDEKDNIYGFWRNSLKETHISYKQTKNNGPNKPKPRDRQLIQDRIMELRELIPNSSKCSIDALLQRTVDHMIFLQSVPIHANKLSQSTWPKAVGDKDLNVGSNQVAQAGASWAWEMGNKLGAFPLIIENLDMPDQMLVEMQCRSYRLFLEVAQAIKRLGVTILKGILETRLEQLWAHFIVERLDGEVSAFDALRDHLPSFEVGQPTLPEYGRPANPTSSINIFLSCEWFDQPIKME